MQGGLGQTSLTYNDNNLYFVQLQARLQIAYDLEGDCRLIRLMDETRPFNCGQSHSFTCEKLRRARLFYPDLTRQIISQKFQLKQSLVSFIDSILLTLLQPQSRQEKSVLLFKGPVDGFNHKFPLFTVAIDQVYPS